MNGRRFLWYLAALGLAAPLHAVTWYVTPNGTGSGLLNWADACSLQYALANASTENGGDEIWVAQGTYYPSVVYPPGGGQRNKTFHIRKDIKVFGGFLGTEGERDQRNPEVNTTILDGDFAQTPGDLGDNAYHVVTIDGAGEPKLSGFTIRNGNADGAGNDALGGGMLVFSEISHLNRLRFLNNRAHAGGGGLFVDTSAAIVGANLHFQGNQTLAGNGGALLVRRAPSKAVFQNCTFYQNQCSGRGGATAVEDGSVRMFLINCTISGNSAAGGSGGAILDDAFGGSWDYTVILSNSIVWANSGSPQIASTDALVTDDVYVQYSDVEDGDWTTPGYSGDGNISADPLFRGSGPRRLSLRRCSPAIEIGANNLLTSDYTDIDDDSVLAGELIPWDFKKVPRVFEYATGLPQLGEVDMGAFEE